MKPAMGEAVRGSRVVSVSGGAGCGSMRVGDASAEASWRCRGALAGIVGSAVVGGRGRADRCVVVAGRRRSARGWWQRGEAGEGGGECVGPGPAALQAQGRAAGVEGESAGGVQQPVAQRLGFADGQLAVERERLGPGDQVLGDQRELQPDGVVGELAEREVLQPGLLGGADAVLGAGAGAVQALQFDRVAGAGRSAWPGSGGRRGR